MRVDPHAEPIVLPGGPTGVVLSHGFTGSPAAVRPWAEYLGAAGFSVVVPRLPGHGTRWQDLNRTGWPDWYAAVERAVLRLAERCSTVVVGGLSMGGALALRVAERHGDRVAGVVLVNPAIASANPALRALPLLRRVRRSVAAIGSDIAKPGADEYAYPQTPLDALASLLCGWKDVRADLPAVTHPVLLFRSAVDHVVDPSSARLIRARIGSADVCEHVLPDSFHVATLDYDAPALFATTVEFVRTVSDRRRG